MLHPTFALLVEDEPQIQRFIRPALAATGFTVEVVADGRRALDRFASPPLPHLVLLDLGLPVTIVAKGSRPVFAAKGLVIDTLAHQLTLEGAVLRFTPREYELLHLLARHAGKVLTHHHLLKSMWGESHVEHLEYLRVFVKRIRGKIEADPAQAGAAEEPAGVGYMLDAGRWTDRPGGGTAP